MSPQLKPVVLYGGIMGPNPGKVSFILEELSIPTEPFFVPMSDIKKPEYEKINPNGRLPSLKDPNKEDFIIWESGAIIEYLIAEYDKENLISFPPGSKEDYLTKQWLYFQATGQGPYYGQAYWFINLDKAGPNSPAIERYQAEIHRVSKVLDTHLKDRQYLVGERCTYADLAWITWQLYAVKLVKYDSATEFPHLQAWLERLLSREKVKKVMDARAKAEAAFAH